MTGDKGDALLRTLVGVEPLQHVVDQEVGFALAVPAPEAVLDGESQRSPALEDAHKARLERWPHALRHHPAGSADQGSVPQLHSHALPHATTRVPGRWLCLLDSFLTNTWI